MEFVDGIDLQAVIRVGRLDFTRKLDLVIQVCKALSYAHRNGVIHKEGTEGAAYLYENREDQSLLVIKKKPNTSAGIEEARRFTSLEHRNIANVLGASKNDRFFIIVMEYLSGGSLEDRLIQPLPVGEALKVAREICEGLSLAHANGVVHGSLQPGNILFSESGRAKIADFGFDEHGGGETGYSLASDPKSVRADIFATAVIFYQMFTGALPGWEKHDLVPNDRFFALPLEIQDLLARMLMSRRGGQGMGPDRVVEEIDGLLEAYEKTAVLEAEPAPSSTGRERTGARGPCWPSSSFCWRLERSEGTCSSAAGWTTSRSCSPGTSTELPGKTGRTGRPRNPRQKRQRPFPSPKSGRSCGR